VVAGIGASMKVRAGSSYRYNPVLMDVCDPPYGVKSEGLKKGDVVKVVNLHGCPPANTMGHCHIELNGRFAGLVCTNSLEALETSRKEPQDGIQNENTSRSDNGKAGQAKS
jgi:hypothetical protein